MSLWRNHSARHQAQPGIDKWTPNLTLRPPTGTITPHILLLVVQLLALASPPFKGRRILSTSAIVVLAILSQLSSPFTADAGSAQPWSLMWPHYLSTLEKILYSGVNGPEGSLWRIDRPTREAMRMTAFGFEKIKWAAVIMINLRGVRWNYQVKNVPQLSKQERRSRWSFVISRGVAFARLLFMTDLLLQLGTRLFFTNPNGELGELNSKFITLRDSDWRWSFVKTLVYGSGPYFFINMQYVACSVLAVLLGFSRPDDWPPFFGKLKDVTTVRDFWGKFWHQSIRKLLNSFTGAFVDAVGIKRNTNWSSYTQIWLAFFISGLFHATSMLMLPSPINVTFTERTVGMMQYFMWQALAITSEDFIQWCWNRVFGKAKQSSTFRTMVGYMWVTCSFWYSLPFAGDVMMRMRLGEKSFLPFTIVGPWMKYVPVR